MLALLTLNTMETIYSAVVMVYCVFAGMSPLLTFFIPPSLSIIRMFGWKRGFGGPPDRGQGIYTYHPDFSNRHPAYFDVLVRNKLQFGNPNCVSTHAVAAAIKEKFKRTANMLGLLRRLGAISFHSSLNWRRSGLLQVFFCFVPSLREQLCAMASCHPSPSTT